mmetsp:Transcript_49165/g.107171  ORF Transcript_49165/g.107171 Transcript_49165/m.107171 type:complete len:88 (-) Transcript_49165:968-1231(-)
MAPDITTDELLHAATELESSPERMSLDLPNLAEGTKRQKRGPIRPGDQMLKRNPHEANPAQSDADRRAITCTKLWVFELVKQTLQQA